uniref:Uncharacterized protein n=1 Tax=Knipowitschia caucasica TaxID=637954 RepID=A0AAV2J9N0_KNICA
MMGKDYSLAIIIVNCDDNVWTDQNLQSDPELPPGWRTITDSTGTYYWHLPTGDTQWEKPGESLPQEKAQELSPGHRPPLRSSWPENLPPAEPRERGDLRDVSDPDSQVFSVRSLGWMQVLEEDLGPGRSSLVVSQVIQNLSQNHSRTRSTESPPQNNDSAETLEASGEGREMRLVLKKESLMLLDPLDHSPLHCQPISNIRVWGVGCNNGRCDARARSISTALHRLCTQMMSHQSTRPPRSLTCDSIAPEDFPRQVQCVEAVQQQQRFPVQYMGNLPVSRATGMEVVNRAINSLMTSDPDDWSSAHIHVSHSALCLWRGEELLWELPVRLLSFLAVGQDTHTFGFIADRGKKFECHVFYCQPHAGELSEAVQAACMVQYQRCLVAQMPRHRPKVKRTTSVDATATALHRFHGNSSSSAHSSGVTNVSGTAVSTSGVRRVMALFDSLRNKPAVT